MNITALCGGVGGAKLAFGLNALEIGLRIVVNTGDDFVHYGLTVCPDFDSVVYTLAGLANTQQGWGRADETFGVQAELAAFDGPPWFMLGDKDIALHLWRAGMLAQGKRLSAIMDDIRRRLAIGCDIWPMSDAACPTMVDCDEGMLAFQDYFVRRRCAPVVKRVLLGGTEQPASPEALAALTHTDLDGIIIVPSNPILSVAPILAVGELRRALAGPDQAGPGGVAVDQRPGGEGTDRENLRRDGAGGYGAGCRAVLCGPDRYFRDGSCRWVVVRGG